MQRPARDKLDELPLALSQFGFHGCGLVEQFFRDGEQHHGAGEHSHGRRQERFSHSHGRYGNSGAATAPNNEKKVLLSSTTAADAVTPASDATGNTLQPRCAVVQYNARQTNNGYEIVRSEAVLQKTAEIPLLSTKTMPRVEFYDGRNWSESHRDAKSRPSALRVVSGGTVIVMIGL